MVYADVVVGVRGSSEELTYAVPAKIIPYIKVGSLVTVPVRSRLSKAVVTKIHQRVDSTLKDKLREIYSIDKTHPGITESQLDTCSNLAKRYLTNQSDILFRLLSSLRPVEITAGKPGLISFLQGSWAQRAGYYQEISRSYQEVLIIFPTNAHLESFRKNYSGEQEVIILDGSAKSRQKIFAVKSSTIFLGTVGDSFFPLKSKGLIIVDQPSHIGASYSNRPFLNSKDIAIERSKTEGSDVLVGRAIISFNDLRYSQLEQLPVKTLSADDLLVTVSSRQGSRELLLDSVKEFIEESIARKRSLLIYVSAKGWSNGVFCRSCQQLLTCKGCDRPVGANQQNLICCYCGQMDRKPNTCPNCRLAELTELGEGIDKFVMELRSNFPKSSLQVVAGPTHSVKAGVDITIATEKIISFPDNRFENVVVASADRALAGNSLDDSWALLSILKEITNRAERVIVQTYFPDHAVWSALNPANLKQYFVTELSARKRFRLPPYAHELTLIGLHPNEAKLSEQVEKIEQVVTRKLPTVEYSIVKSSPIKGDQRAEISLIIPLSVQHLAVNILSEELEPNWAAIPR